MSGSHLHLATWRTVHGLTRQDLASRANVSLSTIGKIESGRSPNQATLKKLEQAFRVPPATLHQDPAMRPVFLASADRQIEQSLGKTRKKRQRAFERTLLMNALFQPGIIIPDIFLFISQPLADHMRSAPKPLLSALREKGIVSIPLRHEQCACCNDALEIIRDQGIGGVRWETAAEVAARLDVLCQAPISYWPAHSVGASFGDIVERYLRSAEPPVMGSRSEPQQEQVRELWAATERWRVQSVETAWLWAKEDAERKKMTIEERGLRRGDIMSAVAADLGLGERTAVHDFADLVRIFSEDPAKQRALAFFCQWLNQCYHINQSLQFAALKSFPNYDPVSGLMAVQDLSLVPATVDPISRVTIETTVRIPSWSVLQTMSADEIAGIRAEEGSHYHAMLASWSRDPNSANEDQVREALKVYTDAIWKRASGYKSEPHALQVILGPWAHPVREIAVNYVNAGAFGLAAGDIAGNIWVAELVALMLGTFAAYRFITSTKPERQQVQLVAPLIGSSRVDLALPPTSRINMGARP